MTSRISLDVRTVLLDVRIVMLDVIDDIIHGHVTFDDVTSGHMTLITSFPVNVSQSTGTPVW